MHPIDFIPNPIVEEIYYLPSTLYSLSEVQSPGDYLKEDDPKWKEFCRRHNLSKVEMCSSRWFNLYLELCAEGLA